MFLLPSSQPSILDVMSWYLGVMMKLHETVESRVPNVVLTLGTVLKTLTELHKYQSSKPMLSLP